MQHLSADSATTSNLPALDSVLEEAGHVLSALAKRKLQVLRYLLGGGTAGVVIALLTPNQYTSTASFIAQGTSSLSLPTALQSAALSVGLDKGTDYSPKFYADLLTSRPVLQSAVLHSYHANDGDAGHPETYLQIQGFKQASPSVALEEGIEHLATCVSATADVRTNMITLSVRTRYPTLSRDIANQLLHALDSLNIGFRQFQSRESRGFFEARANERRRELDSAEAAVRNFLQRNRVTGSPALQFELQRLEREADLKQALYATVMQQYEQARLQEARNVPTLTVLAEAFLPVRKSFPPRRLFVALGMTAGLLALWIRIKVTEALHRFRPARPT